MKNQGNLYLKPSSLCKPPKFLQGLMNVVSKSVSVPLLCHANQKCSLHHWTSLGFDCFKPAAIVARMLTSESICERVEACPFSAKC